MRSLLLSAALLAGSGVMGQDFAGRYISGAGDAEYLELLDRARRAWGCDDELQSIPMLYTPDWDGLVEGPTWGAWWIQNSYGPTLCALPFADDVTLRWIQHAQDLWFQHIGDGQRADGHGHIAPDGQLCDAAAPGWVVFRQGDGRWDMHDWGVEFTAAGVLMQAELLLITRDADAIAHYLPLLERCIDFLDTRRDPDTGLMLAGPAGNLLAPSYAGFRQPDGTYGMAYLTGLSITTIGALDRMIELETLAGKPERAAELATRRMALRAGLSRLMTPDGYYIKYLDPDGTRHGVYGAERFGYFEAVCNHDAVALRVADDAASERIFAFMDTIPGLRPHDLVITQYPSLDDMYEKPEGLWGFGTWVNGGHWSTCEARQILGYYRTGRFDRARASMQAYLKFARQYRIDNPLVEFGAAPYQPRQPVNTVYDTFGIPAAMIRGLFEYVYTADSLTLIPHLPPGITRLVQGFSIRFGDRRLHIAVNGSGPVTSVRVDGRAWPHHDAASVRLPIAELPAGRVEVLLGLGGAEPEGARQGPGPSLPPPPGWFETPEGFEDLAVRLRVAGEVMAREGLVGGEIAQSLALAREWLDACASQQALAWRHLPEPLPDASREAAEALFRDTAARLVAGLDKQILALRSSPDARYRALAEAWLATAPAPGWTCIRQAAGAHSFEVAEDGMTMKVAGGAEASCGWATDLPAPLALPAGSTLEAAVVGGARFFVDLMGDADRPVFSSGWRDPTDQPLRFELPSAEVRRVIVYAMTRDGQPAEWCLSRLSLRAADGTVLAAWP